MNPETTTMNSPEIGADSFLGPTRVRVNINGSGFLGDQQPLSALLDRMEAHALDSWWSDDGLFCNLAHGSLFTGRDKAGMCQFADTGPIYADAPDAVRFWGNFKTYSHSFEIDTDDAEVIELLTAAIAANRARFGAQSSHGDRTNG